MAATRKARSARSVLTKQDIQSRRKSLGEQKLSAPNTGRTAITGTFVLAGSALLLLAIGTFDVQDRTGPGYRNAVGMVGHWLAELFRGGFGITAYVLPFIGLYAAMVMFVGDKEKKRGAQLLSGALLILSTGVLAHLAFRGEAGWVHPPGGHVGRLLGDGLSALFSTVGTVILVSAITVAALIVGTQYVFLQFCAWAWAKACVAWEKGLAWAAAFYAAQMAAWEERKAAAAKAKEEEEAFLAQLEEDERALEEDEAELAAAEAEAVAEEAMRLAREAEARRKVEAREAKAVEEERKAQEKEAKEAALAASAAMRAASPGEDPAWVTDLAALAGPAEEKPAPAVEAKRQQPVVHEPPAPPQPSAAPMVEVASTPHAAVAADTAVAPSPAPVVASSEAALGPPGALPVIVEPKAPPKPSKKKEQEAFEFIGDRKAFSLPPLDLLSAKRHERSPLDKEGFLSTAEKLRAKFAEFGIPGEVKEIRPGPVVTMYEFLPGAGIRISKIASLAPDIAMAMEAKGVRIIAPIPGKNVVGIEVPNRDRETVYLREIAEQDAFQKSASRVTLCLGKDIEGMPYIMDLAKAPHLLMAGTTGSGKSVSVNAMIMSLLMKSTPEEVRFIMVDPKQLELSVYEGIPHLLLPVVTDPRKASNALHWAVEEMERRYKLLAEAGVRNIIGYNAKVAEALAGTSAAPAPARDSGKRRKMLIVDVPPGETADEAVERARREAAAGETQAPVTEGAADEGMDAAVQAAMEDLPPTPEETAALREAKEAAEASAAEKDGAKQELKKLPYIVVIIDELADLIMTVGKEVETSIARIAQKARAAGIHLMVATQRPSTDIVTGVIKANFPTRISFSLRTRHDSTTILGTNGAEALLGQGDMLVLPPTSAHLQRAHGAFVSEEEIAAVVNHLKAQGKPVYDENILKARGEDPELEPGGGDDGEADESYDQALAWVCQRDKVSVSLLQRQFRFGYNKAARIMEKLEREGVVGAADGARPRDVLVRGGLGELPGAGAV